MMTTIQVRVEGNKRRSIHSLPKKKGKYLQAIVQYKQGRELVGSKIEKSCPVTHLSNRSLGMKSVPKTSLFWHPVHTPDLSYKP